MSKFWKEDKFLGQIISKFVYSVSLTLHYIKRRDYLQYFPPISPSVRNAISEQTQLSSELMIALSQQTPLISQEASLQTLLDRNKNHLQSLVPVADRLRNSISDALDDLLAASNAEDTLTPACKEEKSEEKEERY